MRVLAEQRFREQGKIDLDKDAKALASLVRTEGMLLAAYLDDTLEPVPADASAAEVARLLASYNLVSLPVVDQAHRLVGCVSVDDVLDYLLPDDWRTHDSDDPKPKATIRPTATASIPQITTHTPRRR